MEDTGHSFGAYFKRATSPIVVLAILRERPMYVYELAAAMKERSAGKFTISVLYPVLYRLETSRSKIRKSWRVAQEAITRSQKAEKGTSRNVCANMMK